MDTTCCIIAALALANAARLMLARYLSAGRKAPQPARRIRAVMV